MKKEAVHVTTQEEWDYVISKLRDVYYNEFNLYQDKCISIDGGGYCNIKWYIKHDYSVISFQEFKERYELKKLKGFIEVDEYIIQVSKINFYCDYEIVIKDRFLSVGITKDQITKLIQESL